MGSAPKATVTVLLGHGAEAAVFPRAIDALTFALQPGSASTALYTADDERVARERARALSATAEPGQLLMSRATRDLIVDAIPADRALLDLGERTLAGLDRPEPVWLLADAAQTLPLHLTSFIGRQAEVRHARELLAEHRLVTLVGAGGCGKTRLASVVARDAAGRFADGVAWVDLVPVSDPALVAVAIGEELGVRPLPGFTDLQAICAHLAGRELLLVLDNCEHLVETVASVVADVLAAAPRTHVVTTSRTQLGGEGEHVWRVPSLNSPDTVQLFADRATAVRPGFQVTDATAAAIASICDHLDGIPLAVELAAARVRMLTVGEIAARLDDRLGLLTAGRDGGSQRQQTLRASIDWSHALLSPDEQVLLRRLSVFVGGCGLERVEEVCSGDGLDEYAVLNLLAALVDRSLVTVDDQGRQARYRLAEPVRRYSAERLSEAGEEKLLRERHLMAFLALAERTAPNLRGAQQRRWINVLDEDGANLAAAVGHATQTAPELALRLCAALFLWYSAARSSSETTLTYGRALEAGASAPDDLRAIVLAGLATVEMNTGRFAESAATAASAIELAERSGNDVAAAQGLLSAGFSESAAKPDAGRPLLLEGLARAQAAGDAWTIAFGRICLAYGYLFQDDHPAALATCDETEGLTDPTTATGRALIRGSVALLNGRLSEARAIIEAAYGSKEALPTVQTWLDAQISLLAIVEGRAEEAIGPLEQRLAVAMQGGVGLSIPPILTWLSWAELATGRLDEARGRLEFVTGLIDGRDGLLTTWGFWLLAEVLRLQGEAEGATTAAQRAIEMGDDMRNRLGAARGHGVLARLAAAQGEWSRSERHALTQLDALAEGGHLLFVPLCFETMAEIAAGLESYEEAARLLGAAATAREQIGVARWTPEAEHWEALEARLVEALGEVPYAGARRAGGELAIEEAIGWARRARGSRKRPMSGWESLTPTEQQVVELVMQGLTNPQVAERMFISRATVKAHLSHVFRKLDLGSRAELAARAAVREK